MQKKENIPVDPRDVFTLQLVASMLVDYKTARPLMKAQNNLSEMLDPETRQLVPGDPILKLLLIELDELTEIPTKGFFAEDKPGRYEDYLQQEMSDGVIFILELIEKHELPLHEDRVNYQVDELQAVYGFELVDTNASFTPPQPLTDEKSIETFLSLWDLLFKEAAELKNFNEMNINKKVEMTHLLIGILFSMYHVLGLHPIKAVIEKIAKNIYKYEAKDYKKIHPKANPRQILSRYTKVSRRRRAVYNKLHGDTAFYDIDSKLT